MTDYVSCNPETKPLMDWFAHHQARPNSSNFFEAEFDTIIVNTECSVGLCNCDAVAAQHENKPFPVALNIQWQECGGVGAHLSPNSVQAMIGK